METPHRLHPPPRIGLSLVTAARFIRSGLKTSAGRSLNPSDRAQRLRRRRPPLALSSLARGGTNQGAIA